MGTQVSWLARIGRKIQLRRARRIAEKYSWVRFRVFLVVGYVKRPALRIGEGWPWCFSDPVI